MEGKNVFLGILAILLGLIVMAFPLITVFTASIFAGFAIIFLGIWFIVAGFGSWGSSKAVSLAYLILGIIAIIAGLGLFGSVLAFSFFASFALYLVGFYLLIGGILSLFTASDSANKGLGGLGIVLGVLYIIIGSYAWNPFYLAALIGIWLIISGIFQIFMPGQATE
jgi:uncharacterized membrane protein HdeD (DUF308 family)